MVDVSQTLLVNSTGHDFFYQNIAQHIEDKKMSKKLNNDVGLLDGDDYFVRLVSNH